MPTKIEDNTMLDLVYLAGPYSNPDPQVCIRRFETLNQHAARMMQAGIMVFSPISHTHPIALAGDLPKGWDFWEKYDSLYLDMSRAMVVLCLDGWKSSAGVKHEIRVIESQGKPVYYLTPNDPDNLQSILRCLVYLGA